MRSGLAFKVQSAPDINRLFSSGDGYIEAFGHGFLVGAWLRCDNAVPGFMKAVPVGKPLFREPVLVDPTLARCMFEDELFFCLGSRGCVEKDGAGNEKM